jgi:hypothetical protein
LLLGAALLLAIVAGALGGTAPRVAHGEGDPTPSPTPTETINDPGGHGGGGYQPLR